MASIRTARASRKDDGLDPEQVDDILELKLYRLARLEINLIREELAERNKRAKEIKRLLDEETATGRWGIVRQEIEELAKTFGKEPKNKRRTLIEAAENEVEYSAEDFIVAEDNHVLVTADGWVKRQKEINPETTRLREGRSHPLAGGRQHAGDDRVLQQLRHGLHRPHHRHPRHHRLRRADSEAVQAQGRRKDRRGDFDGRTRAAAEGDGDRRKESRMPPRRCMGWRSPATAIRCGSGWMDSAKSRRRSGRRFARPAEGAEVSFAAVVTGSETVIAASREPPRAALQGRRNQLPFRPGQGRAADQAGQDDRLLGVITATDDRDTLTVKTSMGGEQRLNTGRYKVTGRGGRGHEFVSRGQIVEVVYEPVQRRARHAGSGVTRPGDHEQDGRSTKLNDRTPPTTPAASPFSKASTPCASARACTSAAPGRRGCTTSSGKSSTTPSTRP